MAKTKEDDESKKLRAAYSKFYNAVNTHGEKWLMITMHGIELKSAYHQAKNEQLLKWHREVVMKILPEPSNATLDEMIEIGHLVTYGNLEWYFRLGVDGKDLNETADSSSSDLMELARPTSPTSQQIKNRVEQLTKEKGIRLY